jgi:REP element-mobilizing transposase RayT
MERSTLPLWGVTIARECSLLCFIALARVEDFVGVSPDWCRELGWEYGAHLLPHDAKVVEWGSDRTRLEQMVARIKESGGTLGHFPRVVPNNPIDDGINAARQTLRQWWFDEGECSEGLKALRSYRKEWDEVHGTWKDKPRHDWASHEGHLMQDHVHMIISIPPKYAVSQVVGYIKGKSAIHLARVYGERKRSVGQHFWARGYYIVGWDEQAIREYIKNQEQEDMRLEQMNLWR